jgi:RNA polymerase sigma-70 factor (ECF subfamily)
VKDDASLVKQSKSGDRDAFGELVKRYQKNIYYLALRLTGNDDEAWDLSQDVFFRAYRGIGEFRGGSSFRTWLYTIAHNVLKNHYRKVSGQRTESIGDRDIPVKGDEMENILSRELSDILRDAVNELPFKQRMALTLRVYDGLSHREIGKVLGCSEGTVKVNFHHALKSMRKKMIPGGERRY